MTWIRLKLFTCTIWTLFTLFLGFCDSYGLECPTGYWSRSDRTTSSLRLYCKCDWWSARISLGPGDQVSLRKSVVFQSDTTYYLSPHFSARGRMNPFRRSWIVNAAHPPLHHIYEISYVDSLTDFDFQVYRCQPFVLGLVRKKLIHAQCFRTD